MTTAFDPEKPIAKFLRDGKTPVRNVRVEGNFLRAQINTDGRGWSDGAWHLNGSAASPEVEGPLDIVNAPEPHLAVDWGREIRVKETKMPAKRSGKLESVGGKENLVEYQRRNGDWDWCWSTDDGRTMADGIAFENVPAPPKTLRVEIAAATCKDDGREVVFQDNMEAGTLRGIFDNGNITGLFCGSDRRLRAAVHYDIGPWQTVELVLPEAATAKAKGE